MAKATQAVDEQGGGIVEQAFAFEDDHQPMGRAQLAQYRGCRGGVGRGDDVPQGDGRGPAHAGHGQARGPGHHGYGYDHEHDGQPDHGNQVALEVAGRCVIGRVQQGRGYE